MTDGLHRQQQRNQTSSSQRTEPSPWPVRVAPCPSSLLASDAPPSLAGVHALGPLTVNSMAPLPPNVEASSTSHLAAKRKADDDEDRLSQISGDTGQSAKQSDQPSPSARRSLKPLRTVLLACRAGCRGGRRGAYYALHPIAGQLGLPQGRCLGVWVIG